jgi:predicted ATPase/Tfp pilus assembly protein PilF/DNA-binding Xre family transcriptional regulator
MSPPDFAVLLQRFRRKRKLTQEDLALRAGISAQSISLFERGLVRRPHKGTIELLVHALGLAADEAMALYRAARGAPVSDEAPVLRPPEDQPPMSLTQLIGREEEEAAIVHLLSRASVRLLTLTGPAGVGKTRLAIQVAITLKQMLSCETIFVNLTAAREPARVLPAIAQTVGVHDRGALPLPIALAHLLADRRMLLVLDNFEHVVPAAPALVRLLAACPQMKLLVTSRAALHIRGEHEVAVTPLALPDLGHLPAPDVLERVASVALFLTRACAVKPDFTIATEEQGRIVAAICRHLDGLPLAIELAAARVKHVTLHDLHSRLTGRAPLDELAFGPQDLPSHQQTMRSAIAWSYTLLPEAEQRLFRALCVFVGGAPIDGVEAVSGLGGEGLQAGITSLVDKSLLFWTEVNGSTRYSLLSLLQTYGWERLEEHHELGAVQQRHAQYYFALVERGWQALSGPEQLTWLTRLEIEHDNLRAALRWAEACDELAHALELAGKLWLFWQMHGHLSEGFGRLEHLLGLARRRGQRLPAAVLARALMGAGTLAYSMGDLKRAESLVEDALSHWRESEYARGIGAALNNLGLIAEARGEYARARALHEETLTLAHEWADEQSIATSSVNLGRALALAGEHARAVETLNTSLALFRRTGDADGVAEALNNLGELAAQQGEHRQAHTFLEESLALARRLRNMRHEATVLASLGELVQREGDHTQALALFREALALAQEVSDLLVVARCVENHAHTACALGRAERAAQLYTAASALRDTLGSVMTPWQRSRYNHNMITISATLGEGGFTAACATGRALSLQETITLASQEDWSDIAP